MTQLLLSGSDCSARYMVSLSGFDMQETKRSVDTGHVTFVGWGTHLSLLGQSLQLNLQGWKGPIASQYKSPEIHILFDLTQGSMIHIRHYYVQIEQNQLHFNLNLDMKIDNLLVGLFQTWIVPPHYSYTTTPTSSKFGSQFCIVCSLPIREKLKGGDMKSTVNHFGYYAKWLETLVLFIPEWMRSVRLHMIPCTIRCSIKAPFHPCSAKTLSNIILGQIHLSR